MTNRRRLKKVIYLPLLGKHQSLAYTQVLTKLILNTDERKYSYRFVGSILALYYVLKGKIGIKKDDNADHAHDDGFGYFASGQASNHIYYISC